MNPYERFAAALAQMMRYSGNAEQAKIDLSKALQDIADEIVERLHG